MEDESEKEINNLYKIVGYSIITIIIVGIIAMFGLFIFYQTQKIGVVYCEFPYIGDVKYDDAFTMNGNKVGIVKEIYSNEPDRVILTINLKTPITVHENYNLFIGDVGIMGERVVCIENGPQEAPVVSLSDTLQGKYLPGISDMLGRIGELRDFLDDCMVFVNNIQYGTDSARSFAQWLNLAEQKIDKIALSGMNALQGLDGDLPQILEDINNFSDEFNADMKNFRHKLPALLEKTDNIITDCDTILVKLGKIEKIGRDVESSVAKIDTALDINSINTSIHDLQGQIQSIWEEAHKLRLRIKLGWKD